MKCAHCPFEGICPITAKIVIGMADSLDLITQVLTADPELAIAALEAYRIMMWDGSITLISESYEVADRIEDLMAAYMQLETLAPTDFSLMLDTLFEINRFEVGRQDLANIQTQMGTNGFGIVQPPAYC